MGAKSVNDIYWQIKCPNCGTINYYVTDPLPSDNWPYLRWPILLCKCSKYFSKKESEVMKGSVCEKIERPTSLQKRQASKVYLITESRRTNGY